jgi:hypothetical protein
LPGSSASSSSSAPRSIEFNRYNPSVHIRLEGIEPGSLRYTGAFADDPQSLAGVLAREPELSVERRGSIIVVSRR